MRRKKLLLLQAVAVACLFTIHFFTLASAVASDDGVGSTDNNSTSDSGSSGKTNINTSTNANVSILHSDSEPALLGSSESESEPSSKRQQQDGAISLSQPSKLDEGDDLEVPSVGCAHGIKAREVKCYKNPCMHMKCSSGSQCQVSRCRTCHGECIQSDVDPDPYDYEPHHSRKQSSASEKETKRGLNHKGRCPKHTPIVRCFKDPCQGVSVCKLGCRSDYCGGCNARCQCRSNADCKGQGGGQCLGYKRARKSFNGRVAREEKLGVCRGLAPEPEPRACKFGDQCLADEYCGVAGRCLRQGYCEQRGDCFKDPSVFLPMCVGVTFCRNGVCARKCGTVGNHAHAGAGADADADSSATVTHTEEGDGKERKHSERKQKREVADSDTHTNRHKDVLKEDDEKNKLKKHKAKKGQDPAAAADDQRQASMSSPEDTSVGTQWWDGIDDAFSRQYHRFEDWLTKSDWPW